MVWSAVAALLAASLFAWTTSLQRVAASSVASHDGPVHLVRRLVADRRWLGSGAIGAVALALHASALSVGTVMVVQSVMALGLMMALGFEAVREHRWLSPREVVGVALVVSGVALVVVLSRPAADAAAGSPGVVVACGVVVAVVLAAVVRSRHGVGHRWQARVLAAGAGACFAVDAVFLQGLAVAADPLTDGDGSAADVVAVVIGLSGFLASSAVGGRGGAPRIPGRAAAVGAAGAGGGRTGDRVRARGRCAG